MKFFGPAWQHNCERIATPFNVPCFLCDKRIGLDDSGVVMPYMRAEGDTVYAPCHRACLLENLGIE